jgi:hypothetical protein
MTSQFRRYVKLRLLWARVCAAASPTKNDAFQAYMLFADEVEAILSAARKAINEWKANSKTADADRRRHSRVIDLTMEKRLASLTRESNETHDEVVRILEGALKTLHEEAENL